MTKEAPKKHAHLSIFTRHLLLTRGVGFLSAFSLISSGMVWAQNQPVDNSFSIPSTPTSSTPAPAPAPAPRKVAPAPRVSTPAPAPRRVAPAPAPAPRKVAPAPRVSTPAPAPRRVAPAPAPAPRVSTPAPAPATVAAPTAPAISAPETSIKKPAISVRETPRQSVVSPPKVSVPNPRPANPPQVVIPAEIDSPPIVNTNPNPTAANPSGGGKNSYIDSQNYGGGSRNNNQTLPAVVLTERSTGCKTVARNGQLAQASCNINAQRPQTARRNVTNPRRNITPPRNTNRNRGVLSAQGVRPVNYRPVNYARKQGKAPGRLSNPNYKAFKLGSVGNVSPASTKTYAGYNNYYAKTGRPVYASNDNTGLLFPLSIPATITSAFGWRVHPISGNQRMHTGTDIAAPTGTPVLASFIGRVAHADYMGGYGLTVVIRHTEEGNQESRYAHLSQVFVQPGDVVQQGEIIGLVGSTGNSTGPHLHFEWRHLMPSGWVPVDAGLHLEYAMHDLVNSLQAAQLNPISQK